jgi:tetratricopeptide (TPR) repeat protein
VKLHSLAGTAVVFSMLASAPAVAERGPSRHLRCDGMPDNVTAGETAARLLGAVTLLGLFAPRQEGADESARLPGAEGVAICGEALAAESNDVRRAQLILATAVHHIEARQFDQAIAAARQVATDRPAFAATPAFRRSLYLTALDIEATALLELGRTDEAVAKALEMAAAAPYDVVNQLRASFYVGYATHWGPAETAFYDNLARLYPDSLLTRGVNREMNGDVTGALADYDLYMRMHDDQLGGVNASLRTRIALSHALSGNAERAAALIRQANTPPPAPPGKGGDAQPQPQPAGAAAPAPQAEAQAAPQPNAVEVEMNDLYRVWEAASAGDMERARTLYSARSRWVYLDAALRARLVARLRQGATPAQLTGPLAQTPEEIIAAARTERRTGAFGAKGAGAFLFGRRQPYYSPEDFVRFSRDTWRTDGSRIVDFPMDEEGHYRTYSSTRVGGGTPAGYALLLHAALLAHSQGRNAFTLFPTRGSIATLSVRFGNRGEAGMIEPLTFDTERVIADLTPVIPQPVAQR